MSFNIVPCDHSDKYYVEDGDIGYYGPFDSYKDASDFIENDLATLYELGGYPKTINEIEVPDMEEGDDE